MIVLLQMYICVTICDAVVGQLPCFVLQDMEESPDTSGAIAWFAVQ